MKPRRPTLPGSGLGSSVQSSQGNNLSAMPQIYLGPSSNPDVGVRHGFSAIKRGGRTVQQDRDALGKARAIGENRPKLGQGMI